MKLSAVEIVMLDPDPILIQKAVDSAAKSEGRPNQLCRTIEEGSTTPDLLRLKETNSVPITRLANEFAEIRIQVTSSNCSLFVLQHHNIVEELV
jgi:hypothetical protein